MGKGTGHGRKVTKAATPKDEMPRKGYAMKKGGGVKHHEKHMKRGGMSAKRMKPGAAAAALKKAMSPSPVDMSAMGGMGGGAPMGGAPGGMPMKHGGHVIQHHHHYASGGHIRHEDGIAHKAHTKGKMVKMASGGHVGSHPSRRADGIAHKGHTRCKVC
jgi:hypothetical protein